MIDPQGAHRPIPCVSQPVQSHTFTWTLGYTLGPFHFWRPMNYHIVSTGNGTGAIFTSKANAIAFQKTNRGSTYTLRDHLPNRIPPKGCMKVKPEATPKAPLRPTEDISLDGPLTIYTDGSCIGSPGPGGYGVVIKDISGQTVKLSQG